MSGRDNLMPPPVKGEVRNPEGRNQYTYRADAERHLEKWCKIHGEELIERLVTDAAKGKGYAMKLALDRILPAVQQHDIAVIDTADDGLADRLAAVIRARKGNGHDPNPEPRRPESDQ